MYSDFDLTLLQYVFMIIYFVRCTYLRVTSFERWLVGWFFFFLLLPFYSYNIMIVPPAYSYEIRLYRPTRLVITCFTESYGEIMIVIREITMYFWLRANIIRSWPPVLNAMWCMGYILLFFFWKSFFLVWRIKTEIRPLNISSSNYYHG